MAKDVLGKTVRIDDKQFDPKGAKFEVWTKGRHKYIKWLRDGKEGPGATISTENYIDNDKISASLTDDEVIKAWLSQREAFAKLRPDLKVYKVIQDPYSDEPVTKRVYGDGKSPYYLNNGCSINIEWRGQKPNPDFTLGTFSNPEDAENYYRKRTNGVRNGPNRYLRDTVENPVILTSSVDDANDNSKLPTSTWVVEEPFDEGIAGISVEMTEPNYRDKSSVDNKVVTVNMPTGFTENGGKGYLVWTNHGLQYDTKALPYGSEYQRTLLIDTQGNVVDPGSTTSTTGLRAVTAVTTGDIITHFRSGTKDSNIVSEVIEKFKSMVVNLHGISRSDYDLKLCAPDSEACKLIEYKSPLEGPKPQQAAVIDTPPPGPSQSSTKIKLSIQGLFESEDGTTPGSTSSVFEIKAKTDMPTFTIWTGEIPKTEEIDVFDDLEELDDEYSESDFVGSDEAAGEFIATPIEVAEETAAAIQDNTVLSNDTSTSDNGITVTGLAPNTPLPASSLIPAAFNGTPLYSQYDPRWANSPFDWTPGGKKCGDNSTVSSSGCGPSAVSMVINFWASKGKCNPVTPAVVAKFFADFGGRVCGSGSGLGGVPKDKFKNTFGIVIKVGVKESEIMTALKKGYPCVISGKGYTGYNFKGEKLSGKYKGGHFVCLTGIDPQGRIRVNDSGNNPSKGKAITAFLEGKTPSGSTGLGQTCILYPSDMSAPV
jgi:hypothetical protein